ncbi:MAG: hypothetical protein H7X95_01315, partial [Deltaproteobacteria bacterium]|nr:hypothetical protein [Deltaproteobacteria bacterium]
MPRPPRAVPATAVWVDSECEWQLKHTDDSGLLQGPFRSWRSDGSPLTVCAYEQGKQTGPVWKFHPDGSLASLGCFGGGTERGIHHRYASDHPQGERLQSCCVPPGAWHLRQDYSHPKTVDRGWFNRSGQRLLESGDLYPDRPASVPQGAWYNEGGRIWEAGVVFEETGFTGRRMAWSTEGVLQVDEELLRGKRHGRACAFDESGVLLWEAHYIDGQLSGPFRAYHPRAGHFADPEARSQVGTFVRDQAEGVWRTFDAGGAGIHECDLGLPLDESSWAASPAFVNERRAAEQWRQMSERMFVERKVAEGLVAAARAASEAKDAGIAVQAIRAWTLPLGPDAALAEAREGIERAGDNPVLLIDALKRGGHASLVLWALAKALPNSDRAALDLVNTALLLAPDATEPLTTRTLLQAALGDLASARADVATLCLVSPDQGAFLDLYLRISFPRFTFWPAAESFA